VSDQFCLKVEWLPDTGLVIGKPAPRGMTTVLLLDQFGVELLERALVPSHDATRMQIARLTDRKVEDAELAND
jgi:hypothetical protein